MDLDLTKTIGLGLTTAFVGTYTLYQRSVRQISPSRGRLIEEEDKDRDTEETPQSEEQQGGNTVLFPPLPPHEEVSELDTNFYTLSTPISPPVSPTANNKIQSPNRTSQSIFALTSFLPSDLSTGSSDSQADNEDENATTGSIDYRLYRGLLQENEELKIKLDEIIRAQERDIENLMPTTPKGTRWNPHDLLDEVSRLRTEISIINQYLNDTRDQLFVSQQECHEEKKRFQLLANMIMMGRADSRSASLEDIVAALKEWKELALKASENEKKSQEQEAMVIDSTAKIIDLREQLNSLRLGKVQEITELRKQLVSMEESYGRREEELLSRIQTLEIRLINANMQLNLSPVRDELVYLRARAPHDTSFEDIAHSMTASSPSVPKSTASSKIHSTTPRSSSSVTTTPNRLRKNNSGANVAVESSEFTATVPTPLVLSNTLSAVLQGGRDISQPDTPTSSRLSGTPNSSSRPRSSSSNKAKISATSSTSFNSTTSPSKSSSRLSNYTNSSANKNVSTQEFLRMLNDPSGSNGGL